MRKLDLIGQKFGKLVVISQFVNKEKGRIIYKCKCDCGKLCNKDYGGIKTCKLPNCGCVTRFRGVRREEDGSGEVTLTTWSRICNKRSKEHEFTIYHRYVWILFLKQKRKCVYTGLPITFPKNTQPSELLKSTASLDRIDSKKGYIKGNVQWVHKNANLMKQTFSHEHFIKMCNLISKNNPRDVNDLDETFVEKRLTNYK